jgi:2-polyprenyl-3-methyl-5-hydroxy-6-metoxy-1,4-benzoquinol methylase
VVLRRMWQALIVGAGKGGTYENRARQEIDRFAQEEVVNDLPPIFHYWSNKYLRPRLETFGFSYPEDFFAQQIARQITRKGQGVRVISIGAGNCDGEVRIATLLRERGFRDFTIECFDLTPAMLERGAEYATSQGLQSHFQFTCGDFNRWTPQDRYDVVMANQSLHHVTELEALFDAVDQAIGDDGLFVTSDMVGRNGHMRWPEALKIVREFWKELPEAYRYNLQLNWKSRKFLNWDNSQEGFEGIRAQDILPLAIARFGFDFFYAHNNLIDPFIDRSFGPHFQLEKDWDRQFIDRLQARDEAEIEAGRIKPTHMFAVMRRDRHVTPIVWGHLTPQFCVRATTD